MIGRFDGRPGLRPGAGLSVGLPVELGIDVHRSVGLPQKPLDAEFVKTCRAMENTKLVTSAQAAARLGLVPERVRQLAREGKLRAAMVVGKHQRLFDAEDVEALARDRAAATSHSKAVA